MNDRKTDDSDDARVSFTMSKEAYRNLEELARASGQDLGSVLSKAFILYKVSTEAMREGKSVGIASTPDVLETEFVGL